LKPEPPATAGDYWTGTDVTPANVACTLFPDIKDSQNMPIYKSGVGYLLWQQNQIIMDFSCM